MPLALPLLLPGLRAVLAELEVMRTVCPANAPPESWYQRPLKAKRILTRLTLCFVNGMKFYANLALPVLIVGLCWWSTPMVRLQQPDCLHHPARRSQKIASTKSACFCTLPSFSSMPLRRSKWCSGCQMGRKRLASGRGLGVTVSQKQSRNPYEDYGYYDADDYV